MSFVDFSRIGSARPDFNRHQKFSVTSVDIKEKFDPYNFNSESDLTPIKPSGTPNAKALKWFGIILGAIVSVAVIVTIIVCLVVFLGHGHKDDGIDNKRTTLRYQKDKHSSTPPPPSPPPPAAVSKSSSTTTATTTTTTRTTGTTTMTATALTTGTTTTGTTTMTATSATAMTTANGTWSNWGPWTMCAVTCGNSVHSRYRTCIVNTVNDTNCVGNFKEEKECTTTSCPVYGTWATWQSWSNCDVTCGGGTQNRLRTCEKVQNTDIDCVGRSSQQQTCSEWACPDCSQPCTTGSLNSQCDACECSTNIQGLVRNQNGGLLNNVSVAHESAPYRELTTSTVNGTFELNNVCNQQNIILKRSGYQDTSVKITSSSVTIIMQLIQYPMITTQPKSHLRLEGESVAFCCNATGNPAITSYEWLKNGNLLNESFYPDDTKLILTDLKFADSGNVVCRTNSPVGAIYSDSVSLSVRANPDDFCSDAYGPHEINLPSDCVQPNTNSVKYDIGKCSPKDCRKNNSNDEQSCSVDKKYCCISSGRERRIIQCTGYSFPLYITTSCSCGECEDSVITLNGQAIGGTSGLPLRFGTIEIDGNSVGTTGFMGDFSFTVPRGTTRIAVTFKDTFFNQFLDTLKIIRLNEELSGSFAVHVNMIEKSTPIDIYSNVSNTLQLGDQDGTESVASVTIPANSIFYPNGTQFNGVVKASLNIFDPRNSSSLENAPGEFVSIDQEGQTQNLQTFGVFSLSLQDQSGSSLQIAGETEIRLNQTFFESTSIGNVSDAKLWGLNTETGIWEEQGTLSVEHLKRKKRSHYNRDFLVGTIRISAYRWWNLDAPYYSQLCYFKCKVIDGKEDVTNFNVRAIYRIDQANGGVVFRYRDEYISSDRAIPAMCRNNGLKSYIGVQKDGRNFFVDSTNSGLTSPAASSINYQILEANRTISAQVRMSDSGPFYSSKYANFQNKFRFKRDIDDYSLKVFNLNMLEVFTTQSASEIWYPPLKSCNQNDARFRTCFIKIGTVNANTNLLFRVFSRNDAGTIIGIHEKGLTSGSTCIEYRCSVSNPDIYKRRVGSDCFRYPQTYTQIQIIPIGQVCTVLSESSSLRSKEQTNMAWPAPRSNVNDTSFKMNVPHDSHHFLFSEESKYNEIDESKRKTIKACNSGTLDSLSETMIPNVRLATTFKCT